MDKHIAKEVGSNIGLLGLFDEITLFLKFQATYGEFRV